MNLEVLKRTSVLERWVRRVVCYSRIALRALVLSSLAIALTACAIKRDRTIPPGMSNSVIPAGSDMEGYSVNSYPKKYVVHKELPARVDLRVAGSMDGRFRLATLNADEVGDYSKSRNPKLVVVDLVTGELKPTAYAGRVFCFKGGNLALGTSKSADGPDSFKFGKFGKALRVWENTTQPPAGFFLNRQSCTLEKTDGRSNDLTGPNDGHDLLPQHGKIRVTPGVPAARKTPYVPGSLTPKEFAQLTVFEPPARVNLQDWALIKPNGDEVAIPNNPNESFVDHRAGVVDYLPYLDAYFTWPNTSRDRFVRPAIQATYIQQLQERPAFGRLIYPDGSSKLFDTPEAIRTLRALDHIRTPVVLYTKAGLVWKIEFVRKLDGTTWYTGSFHEGFYLQLDAAKKLVKLPVLEPQGSPVDGCTLQLKREVVQTKPWQLFNNSSINVCTGD